MSNYVRKIGKNRGKARIWLEGKCVADAGFKVGDHFQIVTDTDSMFLVKNPEGNRKISGKGEKPIIDMAGSTVSTVFKCEKVNVESNSEGFIHLTANKEK